MAPDYSANFSPLTCTSGHRSSRIDILDTIVPTPTLLADVSSITPRCFFQRQRRQNPLWFGVAASTWCFDAATPGRRLARGEVN